MNKILPKKVADIKGKVAIEELRRAHIIIAILAVGLATILGLSQVGIDPALALAAIILVSPVAVVSLLTAFSLPKK